MEAKFDPQAFISNLTHQPGVYRMYDSDGVVIYVGKAKDLRKRVSSYFRKQVDAVKTKALVNNIVQMDVTVTNSETEALILENSFIKKYRPRYNVLLRDDKSYPYILVSQHEHPRIAFHRGTKREKGEYFGPFPNGYAVRESLRLLQKLFPVRQCDDSYYRSRSRPCLQHQLKRCLAPCVGLPSDAEYAEQVELAKLFLRGKDLQVIENLAERMQNASQALDFETAARFRDQISALRQVQDKNAVSGSQDMLDVIGLHRQNGFSCVHVLFVRAGNIQGSRSYFPKVPANTENNELLESFLLQFYLNQQRAGQIPQEVVLPQGEKLSADIQQVLSDALGKQIKINVNSRGERARYQALATKNAINSVSSKLSTQTTMANRLAALKMALEKARVWDVDRPIERMECFDISHTMGEQTVASCVVFDHEGPLKSDYRRYNINGITPGDDYAAMAQVLERRYKHALEQGNIPDILFIDGGKGQLKQAENYFADWPQPPLLVGVAKGESRKPGLETLFLGFAQGAVQLSEDNPGLHLIQYIRDESHRFAITGHRQRRAKVKKSSSLEEIPGIGPKRRRNLLNNLGGLQQVKSASIEQLAQVPGISRSMAETIYHAFRDE